MRLLLYFPYSDVFIGCFVSIAQNFVDLQSGGGQLLLSDLRRVIQICLLSTAEKELSSALPDFEKVAAIGKDHFLEGIRLSTALEKLNSLL